MSFHAYLKSINKANKQLNELNSKFIPPLEEPDFRVKTNCSGGHAPWPEGICTKCQPGAVTLALQVRIELKFFVLFIFLSNISSKT